jgi:CRP-like cAMP-binding protein
MGLIIGEKRKATVRAKVDTEVLVIDFDRLMMLIDNDENKINKEVIRRMESNLLVEDNEQ